MQFCIRLNFAFYLLQIAARSVLSVPFSENRLTYGSPMLYTVYTAFCYLIEYEKDTLSPLLNGLLIPTEFL